MFVNEEELTEIEKKEKLLKDIQRIIGIGENTTADYQCGYNYAISKIGYIIRDKDKEIEKLHSIIKEVREYIEPIVELDNDIMLKGKMLKPVLEILDKEVN